MAACLYGFHSFGTVHFGVWLVAQRKGSTVEHLHLDHLGSLTLSTSANSSAYTVARREYFPFGIVRESTGTANTQRQFTGQVRDESGGPFYFR